MTGLRFEHPWLLAALALIPLLMLWRRLRGRATMLVLPYAAAWGAGVVVRGRWRIAALYAAMALLVVAAARPQRVDALSRTEQRGYDLMLAVDLSTSMLSEDYRGPHGRVNRLETIRPVLRAFIRGRPHDRMGLVVFARRAMTLVPLTTDRDWLLRQVAGLRTGMIEDGTAIGDGLGIALADLADGRADERAEDRDAGVGAFVVLLTDGSNNSGDLTPPEATAIARHRRVPVYAVGTGRNGMVPFPVFDAAGRRTGTTEQPSAIDVEALRTIAGQTGGRLFMADDAQGVASAFRQIDRARKARFHARVELVTHELFAWAAVPALLLLGVAAAGGVPGGRRRRAGPVPA